MRIYSIRDAKAEIFNAPFYKHTHGEAERDFTMLVNDEKSTVCKFPEDYDLYHLGSFDEKSGKAEWLDTPQHISKAINVKQLVQ